MNFRMTNRVQAIGGIIILMFLLVGATQKVEAQTPDSTAADSLSHALRSQKYSGLGPVTEQDWGDYQGIADSVAPLGDFILKDSVEVFGWHPYWSGTAYKNYDFSMLSTIAYFSYELNPKTGGYKTIHDWKTTALIDSARAENPNIKILLTVTNFGKKNNREFLGVIRGQGARKQNLIDSLQVLLKLRKADGVVLDFEDVGRLEKKSLTDFVKELSTALKPNKYLVSMTLPAYDPHEIYDVKELTPFVDRFIIMTYGYYYSGSKKAGPVSPLVPSNTWGQGSVEQSLQDYAKLGLPPSKTLVGVPYYGEMWETHSADVPADVKRFRGTRTYKQIRNAFPYQPKFDQDSYSAYFNYTRQDNGEHRQLWFEDERSLAPLYDRVNQGNYRGVGLWALGDDDGYQDLWELLADKFGVEGKIDTTKIDETEDEIVDAAHKIEKDAEKAVGYLGEWVNDAKAWLGIKSNLETPIVFLVLVALTILLFPVVFFVVKLKELIKEHSVALYFVVSLILLLSIIFDKDILVESPQRIPAMDMVLLLIATATLGVLVANLLHHLVFNKKDLP
ncbi:glycosyl hydrolase family 18 protein [Gracilimonas mengyeensis]|uniref:Glycosyl hydrolases family 18 n=1 Tax=Gracilimonas mengyeensis TaxID=1302730 RepID=A0A521BNL8_9BACT|nr:glycosyl hydrolase family 18 protein [Gracilimonas mengyeensis]SMO48733.1 Glycosyl hydrolases family 18 [Gracilimonas mengyeensis]